MNRVKLAFFAATISGTIGLIGASSAQALTLPLIAGAASPAGSAIEAPIAEKVQFRGRRGGFRGRSRGFRGGRSRGRRGFGSGAAIGLGILGLGLAGAAIANQGYHRRCWYEDREVFNRWGDYAGVRQVKVCN